MPEATDLAAVYPKRDSIKLKKELSATVKIKTIKPINMEIKIVCKLTDLKLKSFKVCEIFFLLSFYTETANLK